MKNRFAFKPGDIEYYVAGFIRKNKERFAGRVCIDSPAGQGVTSRVLAEAGARVLAYDIFPDYFKCEGVRCEYADLARNIPLPGEHADWIICQEGLEHISDQLQVFREFNRVLKKGGRLLVTVPNSSNLKSRLGNFFFESECYGRDMPLNEIDTVWHAKGDGNGKIYYGHAFLPGIQRLRFLGRVCGFSIVASHATKINKTSLLFFPILFPLVYLVSLRTYWYAMRKKKAAGLHNHIGPYRECLKLNISLNTLLCKNLFLEFRKDQTCEEAGQTLSQGKNESPWETVSNKQKSY